MKTKKKEYLDFLRNEIVEKLPAEQKETAMNCGTSVLEKRFIERENFVEVVYLTGMYSLPVIKLIGDKTQVENILQNIKRLF